MAKAPKSADPDLEIDPQAWARFERAIDVVAKSPPQHRMKAKASRAKSPAKRKAVKKLGK